MLAWVQIVSPFYMICFHLGCYFISLGARSGVMFCIKVNEMFVCLCCSSSELPRLIAMKHVGSHIYPHYTLLGVLT